MRRGRSLAVQIVGGVVIVVVVLAVWLGVTLWQGSRQQGLQQVADWGALSATGVARGEPDTIYLSYFREIYRFNTRSGRLDLLAGRLGDPAQPAPTDDGQQAVGAVMRPVAVAATSDGRTYFADQLSGSVRGVEQGQLRTVGKAAQLGGIAVDGSGTLYFADRVNDQVFKVELQSGTVSPVAGTGQAGYGGDGGPAAKAKLDAPDGVAVDSQGDLYIADTGNQRIRMVDPGGTISTVAGSGDAGFSGDGGKAIDARLSQPVAVAVDGDRNLYVSDGGNHRVRKVDSGGTIRTLAGSGATGVDDPTATVSAGAAHLNQPAAIAYTPGGVVYLVDDFQLRRIDQSGVTFVAPPTKPS
jgi:trimeric autotransporter adhesin